MNKILLKIINIIILLRYPMLAARFYIKMNYLPNVSAPKTYNEKVLWRKIFDRNFLFVIFSDKLKNKEFLHSKLPELPIAKTLWKGQAAEDIPADIINRDFIIKANHGSGFNYISLSEYKNYDQIKKLSNAWLRVKYGKNKGEWAYSCVQPSIFIEELLPLGGEGSPTDIKVHVCCGKIVHIWAVDYKSGRSITLDENANSLNAQAIRKIDPDEHLVISTEITFLVKQAINYAAQIGKDIDYARIDFLVSNGRLFGGEVTVYPASGHDRWDNPIIEKRLSAAWNLCDSSFFRKDQQGFMKIYFRELSKYLKLERENTRIGS